MRKASKPHEENWERVLQDAETAWNEYQATGLHVAAEEVDAWLEYLEHPQPHF
jgi:predicted transcriptional regulator